MRKVILDANSILRYMLNDIPEQADATENTLLTREILILPEVVAEVVYTLVKYYKYTRKEAAHDILEFLKDADYTELTLLTALNTYSDMNLDFVDCLLFAYSMHYDVLTFDKALQKLIAKGGAV